MAVKNENQISSLSDIGQRIQQARINQNITVAQLSAITAISSDQIIHIEAGAFHKILGRPKLLGFTRAICNALALDSKEIVRAVESRLYPVVITPPALGGDPAERETRFASAMRFIRTIFVPR
ncbi:MAG: helix-turn-helix domain-containing protein [Polymorphobacter sp.]